MSYKNDFEKKSNWHSTAPGVPSISRDCAIYLIFWRLVFKEWSDLATHPIIFTSFLSKELLHRYLCPSRLLKNFIYLIRVSYYLSKTATTYGVGIGKGISTQTFGNQWVSQAFSEQWFAPRTLTSRNTLVQFIRILCTHVVHSFDNELFFHEITAIWLCNTIWNSFYIHSYR